MGQHQLKTWPEYFQAILEGAKTFEIRTTWDRTFRVGDVLILQEWDPETKLHSGRVTTRKVTYVCAGPPWLPEGLAVLGLNGGFTEDKGTRGDGYRVDGTAIDPECGSIEVSRDRPT
jgi:hypothetical protein